jgi:Secretory lipase
MPVWGPCARRGAVVAAALIMTCVAAPAAASAVRAPAGLAFYSPPKRLLVGPHGSVIWARRVHSPLSATAREYRVLYRSRSIAGKPVAVSGLVDMPRRRAPAGGWPVVSWGHVTVGVADVCAPSRDPTRITLVPGVYSLFNGLLRRGYVITRTDYEGLGTRGVHPYLIGRSEGRGMLDSVRAARHLDSRVGRRLAIGGYSQGGHAALWAAALAPRWARGLDFRGVVTLAPASHLGTLIRRDPAATIAPANAGAARTSDAMANVAAAAMTCNLVKRIQAPSAAVRGRRRLLPTTLISPSPIPGDGIRSRDLALRSMLRSLSAPADQRWS